LRLACSQPKLQLVTAAVTVPPLPSVAHLYESAVRRPGELHERVDLEADTLRHAVTGARRAGLPLGLTVGLLVEAALLRADVAAIDAGNVECELDRAAATRRVTRRLSAGEADYVRTLWGSGFARTVPTVPLRLFGRLAAVDLDEALAAEPAQAARWEAAALLENRTMVEWALMRVAGRM